jgi:hypothetical protein
MPPVCERPAFANGFRYIAILRLEPFTSGASDMLKCHECCSDQISVWGGLWVDFREGGHREVDEQELDEFEPKFGDSMFCRACGFTWTYGHPCEIDGGR